MPDIATGRTGLVCKNQEYDRKDQHDSLSSSSLFLIMATRLNKMTKPSPTIDKWLNIKWKCAAFMCLGFNSPQGKYLIDFFVKLIQPVKYRLVILILLSLLFYRIFLQQYLYKPSFGLHTLNHIK